MTTFPIEHANQIAEFNASRDVIEGVENAARLRLWKARYPYDAIEAPAAVHPPEWPAPRVSIEPTADVIELFKHERPIW